MEGVVEQHANKFEAHITPKNMSRVFVYWWETHAPYENTRALVLDHEMAHNTRTMCGGDKHDVVLSARWPQYRVRSEKVANVT